MREADKKEERLQSMLFLHAGGEEALNTFLLDSNEDKGGKSSFD